MSTAAPWSVEHVRGPAGVLHAGAADFVAAGPAGAELARTVRIMDAEAPALVLGSTQPESDVDHAAADAAGIEVARRRSGGGAVLVGAAEVVWVDVAVPAGDPLSDADVGRASWWIGECWARALARTADLDTGPAEVWRGPLVRTRWSRLVCFAGLGPGEVVVGGRKVVGVSQRRTRQGALLQTAALLRWRPGPFLDLFALSDEDRGAAADDLAAVAAGVGAELGPALLAALVEEIDRAG